AFRGRRSGAFTHDRAATIGRGRVAAGRIRPRTGTVGTAAREGAGAAM
ncbi:MAG: hypothetical protein AVDCRST_MAG59-4704, partial [uncultured Thermomicrobiales bacterium]